MDVRFEELAREETRAGTLTLRRRREPALDVDVYEVKLDHEFLMSSLFTVSEVELARLALAAVEAAEVEVVVGGLGLGYTACEVLEDPRVTSLVVIESSAALIDWHRQELLPDVAGLARDPRVRFVHGDFFELAAGADGFDPDQAGRQFDAVVVDIDHTPRHLLDPSHAPFYTSEGLSGLANHLGPGGAFALWSDDPPDDRFLVVLEQVFSDVDAHVVAFANFLTGGESANTVYVAR